jgi:hypothetical protein
VNGHLGSWVSALADGQLPPDQAERALAHVAVCRRCAAELEAARAARRALAAAADVPVAPDLAARLLALSATVPSCEGDPLRQRPQQDPWAQPSPWTAPLTNDLLAAARRRRVRRLAALGAGGVGVAAVALFAVGDVPVVAPDPSPEQVLTLLARAEPSETAAGEDLLGAVAPVATHRAADSRDSAALTWMGDQGWVRPERLPDGLDVSALRLLGPGADVVELDLAGSAGHVVVREQVGRLDASTGERRTVGGRAVVVLSTEPWHVAWQADDVVVDVAADVPQEVMAQVVAAFPADGYDSGVLARVVRGWSTVTGALPQR